MRYRVQLVSPLGDACDTRVTDYTPISIKGFSHDVHEIVDNIVRDNNGLRMGEKIVIEVAK